MWLPWIEFPAFERALTRPARWGYRKNSCGKVKKLRRMREMRAQLLEEMLICRCWLHLQMTNKLHTGGFIWPV